MSSVKTMQDTVELVADWPQPSSVGAPRIRTGDGPLRVTYATGNDEVATLEFALCHRLIYGHPNDRRVSGSRRATSGR